MSNTGNKYKVGLLVFSSFMALAIILLSLGITKYFRKTYEFMTVVETSVQGLEKGAKVKFKGVTVGKVKKIQLDTTSDDNKIYIIMEFDPKAFSQSGTPSEQNKIDALNEGELKFRKNLSKNVDKGLRCQLQYQGITGTQYVEISYYNPQKHQVKEIKLYQDHPPYLPSVESVSVTNILTEAQDAVTEIAKIEFKKISQKLEQFLDESNKLIKNKDTSETMKDMKDISSNLKAITGRLNRNIDDKMMVEFVEKLNTAIDNINKLANVSTQLVEYLEKNPEAVLRGKPEKPIVDPK